MHSSPQPGPDVGAPAPRSTLVFGTDETGISALATGLALRRHGSFRWVDCARNAPVDDLPAHWIFARGAKRPEVGRVDLRLLRSSPLTPATLRELVIADGPEEERRLASFLALPELFQRLGARYADGDGPIAALLANVDRLPSDLRARLFEQRAFHELLHRAGIDLFSTATTSPSPPLADAYDRLYRLEVPSGASWAHGSVVEEKNDGRAVVRRPLSVRGAWVEWQLDPTLLPLL